MKKLWLYLHFPYLQLDCQFQRGNDRHSNVQQSNVQQSNVQQSNNLQNNDPQHSNPPSTDTPIIILDARDNRIRQLNSAAQQHGIKTGMGLGTASALSQTLQVEPYNPDLEHNKIKHIADSLYQLTSDIALFFPCGILLRIHNMLRFYEGLEQYWQTIRQAVEQFGLRWQYATGSTPFAAKILAETGWNNITDDHQAMRAAVLTRNLHDSELSHKTIEHLTRVGIKTLGELATMPLSEIAKRFDIQLVTYTGRLLGELHHNVPFYHPEKRFNRRLELLYEIDNSETLLHPAKHLLEALQAFLLIRDQITDTLLLQLHQREKPTVAIDILSAEGEYRASQWQTLLKLKLENVTLAAPVFALALSTGETRQNTPQKQDLFEGKKSTLSNAQLISLLQAKLGVQSIQRIHLGDDYRPEYSNQCLSAEKALPDTPPLLANRPCFLLNPAQPLTEKVRLISPPERLLTGWWDDAQVQRDYFIAYSSRGRWYWVFRTSDRQWYLQGIFS